MTRIGYFNFYKVFKNNTVADSLSLAGFHDFYFIFYNAVISQCALKINCKIFRSGFSAYKIFHCTLSQWRTLNVFYLKGNVNK